MLRPLLLPGFAPFRPFPFLVPVFRCTFAPVVLTRPTFHRRAGELVPPFTFFFVRPWFLFAPPTYDWEPVERLKFSVPLFLSIIDTSFPFFSIDGLPPTHWRKPRLNTLAHLRPLMLTPLPLSRCSVGPRSIFCANISLSTPLFFSLWRRSTELVKPEEIFVGPYWLGSFRAF